MLLQGIFQRLKQGRVNRGSNDCDKGIVEYNLLDVGSNPT